MPQRGNHFADISTRARATIAELGARFVRSGNTLLCHGHRCAGALPRLGPLRAVGSCDMRKEAQASHPCKPLHLSAVFVQVFGQGCVRSGAVPEAMMPPQQQRNAAAASCALAQA